MHFFFKIIWQVYFQQLHLLVIIAKQRQCRHDSPDRTSYSKLQNDLLNFWRVMWCSRTSCGACYIAVPTDKRIMSPSVAVLWNMPFSITWNTTSIRVWKPFSGIWDFSQNNITSISRICIFFLLAISAYPVSRLRWGVPNYLVWQTQPVT